MAELVHGDQYAKRNNKSGQIPENAQHKTFRQIVLKTNNSRQANTGTAAVRLSMRSKNTAMSGDQMPAILDAGFTLKHTFRQIAQH